MAKAAIAKVANVFNFIGYDFTMYTLFKHISLHVSQRPVKHIKVYIGIDTRHRAIVGVLPKLP